MMLDDRRLVLPIDPTHRLIREEPRQKGPPHRDKPSNEQGKADRGRSLRHRIDEDPEAELQRSKTCHLLRALPRLEQRLNVAISFRGPPLWVREGQEEPVHEAVARKGA